MFYPEGVTMDEGNNSMRKKPDSRMALYEKLWNRNRNRIRRFSPRGGVAGCWAAIWVVVLISD